MELREPTVGRENCCCRARDVVLGCRPRADADAHRRPPAPGRAAAPAGTAVLDQVDSASRSIVVSERDHDLVQDDVVQDFDPRVLQPFRELSRKPAATVDQLGQLGSTSDFNADQISTARARRELSGV